MATFGAELARVHSATAAGPDSINLGFGLGLAVDFAAQIFIFHIAAHIGIKQNRVSNLIAVLAKAANGIHIQPNSLDENAEGNGAGCAIFITDNFLSIKRVFLDKFALLA